MNRNASDGLFRSSIDWSDCQTSHRSQVCCWVGINPMTHNFSHFSHEWLEEKLWNLFVTVALAMLIEPKGTAEAGGAVWLG